MSNGANNPRDSYDAVVVGAGFAGLYMLHRLREQGLAVLVVEAAEGVGGTWYWNRYPGARCDVESLEYSYQFSEELQQEWEWTERYASQPEILRYIEHVADRFDLLRDIQFETRVRAVHFDAAENRWDIDTTRGHLRATYCIMATGCLSIPVSPEIPDEETYRGRVLHTARWPQEGVDFSGQRVGLIGTGSSGVQSIPLIAREASHLTVFQRTATFAVPAHNGPLDPEYQKDVKSRYSAFRAANRKAHLGFGSDYPASDDLASQATEKERHARYEERWQRGGLHFMGSFIDLMLDAKVNEGAAEFVRDKIRAVVDDAEVAARLSPDGVLGCKRLCVDTDYYQTFNRSNVELVDIQRDPIEGFTAEGLRTGSREYAFDSIVFATGFDAMTGALNRIDVRGLGGESLRERWAEGPRTYLGLAVRGFPNFFVITGPGSPSVFSNMVPSIEQHVEWIGDCIEFMRERGHCRFDIDPEAEDEWVQHVGDVASVTLYYGCNSWYLGSNIEGKPRVFMPYLSFPTYVAKCEEVASGDYPGFRFS